MSLFYKIFLRCNFWSQMALKLLTNAYLKRLESRGKCRGNAFLMRPRWQSKAESPELQWRWKLEVLSCGHAPRVPVLPGTSLPALLCPLHHHLHLGGPTGCNLQTTLWTFPLDIHHNHVRLARQAASASPQRWGSWISESLGDLPKVTQKQRVLNQDF